MSPADLGNTSAVLDERKDDRDRPSETVGSSFGPLLPLLDVRPDWTDDLNPFSPALEGIRNGLRQPSHVLDELREDLDESSQRREEFREELEESSQCLEESSQRLKE